MEILEFKIGDLLELTIEDLAFGGKGISKEYGVVIFVDGALPGQTVKSRVTKKKRRYVEAKMLEVIYRSTDELVLDYQEVPGAPWMRLPLRKQVEYKEKQVKELFKKFSDTDLDSIWDETIMSPLVWAYRNKMEYSFGITNEYFTEEMDKKIWHHEGYGLGSKKRGQFFLVESLLKPSGLFDFDFEKLIPKIEKLCRDSGLPVYNQRINKGFFRYLVVRKSIYEDRFLINLITTSHQSSTQKFKIFQELFLNLLKNILGNRLAGLFWSINDQVSDTANNHVFRKLIWGEEKIIESINGLSFEVALDSFFQTNLYSAEKLYQKVLNYAGIKEKGLYLDLYCGTGTVAQILANECLECRVIGVDIEESAVEDARLNAKRNNLSNVEFFCEDVRIFLKNHSELVGMIDALVIDPPRSGLSPKALQRSIDLGSSNIIYVSCNPSTMARDTKILKLNGFKLSKFTMVDQFPHTSHIECLGLFKKE